MLFFADQPLLLRPFAACRCSTAANVPAYIHPSICLSTRRTPRQSLFFTPIDGPRQLPRARLFPRLLVAFVQSNTLSALLPAMVFLHRAAALLDAEWNALIPAAPLSVFISDVWHLPPLVPALTTVLLVGWLLVFAGQLFTLCPFDSVLHHQKLYICHGLWFRHAELFFLRRLRGICIRQSLLMYWAGIHTVSALLPGKRPTSSPMLAPALRTNQLQQWLQQIGFSASMENPVVPPRRALFRYLKTDLLGLVGCLAGLCVSKSDRWGGWLRLTLVGLVFMFLWHFIRSVIAFRQTGITVHRHCVIVRCAVRFSLQTFLLPPRKIAAIEMTQHLFQRRAHLCHLHIHIDGSRARITLRHLDLHDALRICKKCPKQS